MRRPPPEALDLSTWPGVDTSALDAEARRRYQHRAAAIEEYRRGSALTVIEDDKAWYVEHRFLSTERAKAVTRGINDRCRLLRPHAETLVDGFGIPEQLRYAEMLHPENLPG